MPLLAEIFSDLATVIAPEPVRVVDSGWTTKARRAYASPSQAGTGQGPFVEVIDATWNATFEGMGPLAGILLWANGRGLSWVKSLPAAERPQARFSVSGWAGSPCSVFASAAFHGTYSTAVPLGLDVEPSFACALGSDVVTTSVLHIVARMDPVAFAVVLLPGTALRSGRNRLWHLRPELATKLAPKLRALMTQGRTGDIELDAMA
jgi:hypothetical protein